MEKQNVEPVVSDNPSDAGSADQSEVVANKELGDDNSVRYSTYQRAVQEAKAAKQREAEAKKELQNIKLGQEEAAGNLKEVVEALRKEVAQKEKLLEETNEAFVWTNLNQKVEESAVRNGLDPDSVDVFLKCIKSEDLNTIEMNGLVPNGGDVDKLVQKYKTKKGVSKLFMPTGPKIDDMSPTNQVPAQPEPKPLTLEQKLEQLRGQLKAGE